MAEVPTKNPASPEAHGSPAVAGEASAHGEVLNPVDRLTEVFYGTIMGTALVAMTIALRG